ncbi:hypothetical protein HYE07_03720 [Mycoplasmopsis bovis]|nr:hypothetical protein [Mycoplasmopsis bovis]QQH27209.1 hypothetical protein HYE07_03720 [Mycoplasmopsis bovis]
MVRPKKKRNQEEKLRNQQTKAKIEPGKTIQKILIWLKESNSKFPSAKSTELGKRNHRSKKQAKEKIEASNTKKL